MEYSCKALYDYLEDNKDVGLVGTQIEYFMKDDGVTLKNPLFLNHNDIFKALINGKHAIIHPSIMFRTQIAKEIGGYKINSIGEDLDLFIRFSERSKL